MRNPKQSWRAAAVCAAALVGVYLVASFGETAAKGASLDHPLPAAQVDETPNASGTETLILAGGCFWGVQGVFQHVRGVVNAVSGYDGGTAGTAQYEVVSTGTTGHAESVRITYDPKIITYGHLLQIFFSVTTDPTQLNEQYPDRGTQYRSEIFATTPEQVRIAKAYIAQLNQSKAFPKPIVTQVGQDTGFYPAEAYHQNFLTLHPDSPYIAAFDLPKIKALQTVFPTAFRPDPVLVAKLAS
ncbi:MAG TPA: peptide-methionine (S)-S-oxide reductase MsrA [Rhodopila sp.]|jgi:peptide-methionine (S)-S-oxide reductase|nr:peptide-methionine (S)-S-oxide reductase MsrA [Rhodopila sp.]